MQSTAAPAALATLQTTLAQHAGASAPTPPDLLAAFASLPDSRRRRGRRFPLPALLTLAAVALLSNHLSVLAIAEWGKAQPPERLQRLGLARGIAPHQSTLHRLFAKLDPSALANALGRCFAPPAAATPPPRGSQGVAIDGKAQRGRLAFGASGSPVHAVTVVDHERGVVLAHHPTTDGQSDKAAAELAVAPRLLAGLDLRGRVVTGDALYCQRKLCEQILAAGGDYLFIVKANQPTLYEDLRLLFDPDPSERTLPLTDRREARTVEYGHGRHQDTRHLIASTDLMGYSDWPGLIQALRWQRTWQEQDPSEPDRRYGITSLPPAVAGAARLLQLKRDHWICENGLHYVKDVTLGEDRSLIHRGFGPSVLAVLRDTVVSLLHQAGCWMIASRLRFHSTHPDAAIALVLGENA